MAGHIKIDRDIRDHWVYKDPEYFIVWFEMLCCARYSTEAKTDLQGDEIYTINYGEFMFGRISWSERLNVSEQRLRTLIKKLIKEDMISLVSKFRRFSIYKITNYEKFNQQTNHQKTQSYQGVEELANQQINREPTSSQPAANQQPTTKEESKEGSKKVKKVNKKDIIPKINVAEFVSMTQEEYDKLLEAHGQDKLNRIIETLDNYKGSTGKKYTSDYRAILNWVITRVEDDERKLKLIPGGGNSGKYAGGSEVVRHGGAKKESEYAFLDVSSPRTGTTPYDPTIF